MIPLEIVRMEDDGIKVVRRGLVPELEAKKWAKASDGVIRMTELLADSLVNRESLFANVQWEQP